MRVSSAFVMKLYRVLSQHSGTKFLRAAILTTNCERRIAHSLANHSSLPSNGKISKEQAIELTLRLTSDERKTLMCALQEYESKIIKEEYEGDTIFYNFRQFLFQCTHPPIYTFSL